MPVEREIADSLYEAGVREGMSEAELYLAGDLLLALLDDPEIAAYADRLTADEFVALLHTPVLEFSRVGDLSDVGALHESIQQAIRSTVARQSAALAGPPTVERMAVPASIRRTVQSGFRGVSGLTRVPSWWGRRPADWHRMGTDAQRAWERRMAARQREWREAHDVPEWVELEADQVFTPALAGPARPAVAGRLPRAPARTAAQQRQAFTTVVADKIRDRLRAARARSRAQTAAERRRGIEIERGPGGTVTAGPRKRKRRKPRR